MVGPQILIKILEGLTEEVMTQLRLAKSVGHSGESGRAREEIVRRFLRKIVPAEYSIDSGFVIDSIGGISRQVDIVVFLRDYHPVLEIGGVRYFMVEGVAAVIENKAAIPSRNELDDALDSVASVKRLDRTGGGVNYYLDPGVFLEPVDMDDFRSQVFTAIVTQTCLSKKNVAERLESHLLANPRNQWLNLFACLNSFAVLYEREEQGQSFLSADPMPAQRLLFTSPELGSAHALIDLAKELLNYLRVAHRIDYRASRYFPGGGLGDIAIDLPSSESE